MTTFFAFAPSRRAVPQFSPTLDGSQYLCTVTWNLFGQRYYLGCYDLSGALQFFVAMVGSPLDYDISLSAGYFTNRLVWRSPNGQFEVID